MRIDISIVQSAPELATLEILARVLDGAITVLVSSHPCLESDIPCHYPFAPCHRADNIYNCIHELGNAILAYRAAIAAAIANEEKPELPF